MKRQKLIAAIALPSILALAGIVMIGLQLRQERMNEDLVEAVQKNDVNRALTLLNSGADANRRISNSLRRDLSTMLLDMFKGKLTRSNQDGMCLLAVAVVKDDSAIAKALLIHNARGVNETTEIPDQWGLSSHETVPILIAAMRLKKPDVVLLMLDHGADIHVRDENGDGVLLNAIHLFPNPENRIEAPQHFRKDEELALSFVKELIRRGSDPLEKNNWNQILLEKSASQNRTAIGEYLLSFGANKTSLANALDYAVSNDNQSFATKLILKGAEADRSKANEDGPIFSATTVPMMRLLVAHGAKLNVRLKSYKHTGYSLIHCAAIDGDLKRMQYLIEQGADVNDNYKGATTTPLVLASQYADLPMLELLIRHGAKVNPAFKDYDSALLSASEEGIDENIDCLLEHGADPNVRASYDGTTALMNAVENGNDEAVRNLLAGGAKVNLLDKQGHRALDFADGNEPVITLLKKYGAKAGHGPAMNL